MKRVIVCAALALALLAVLVGCGGSKSSSSTTAITLALSPATATVNTTATQQFTATVTNTTNTAVSWLVNGIAGGNQTVGFISSSGLYTAPSAVPTPASVTITAVSQASTSVSANATVTITAAATPSATLVISPTSATVPAGGQQTFTATVGGSPVAVKWTLNCQTTTPGACGSISDSGVYTAPLSPPPGQNVSVTAMPQTTGVPAAGAVVTIQFGNGTLSGQYAFSLSGQNAGAVYLATGSATFDGNGSITAGVMDIDAGGTISTGVAITSGTYHIGTDGRGNATVNTASGTVTWQFVAISHSHALLIRFDSGVPGASGTMDLQDLAQFSAAGFSGAYAFNLSGANGSGKAGTLAVAGALTSDGVSLISNGVQDVNNNGSASNSFVSGTYAAPSASGRGTLVLNGTNNFAFYIVDATHVKLIGIDAGTQLAGDAYKQAASPFSAASFSHGYAFAFLGSSGGLVLGEGGVMTLDGTGRVSSASIDLNRNGNQTSVSTTGTYTVADTATGRTTLSLGTLQYVVYPQANGGLSVVEIDSGNVVAGRAQMQAATAFSTGNVLGNYGLNLGGTDFTTNPGEEDAVASVVPNGGTALTGTMDVSDNGVIARSATLSGSYSVSLSGRGTATLTTPSSSFVSGSFTIYVGDNNTVFFLETDGNRVLIGTMQKQF